MIAQSIATGTRGAVSVFLAWQGAGVWSLVWGPLAGTASGSLVNWAFCRWRPSFHWSWRHFRELFRFGKNVFGERFLGYFAANSDYIITGRLLGASALGFYNFSYQIPHLAETHVAPIVTRVLFPVLSRVQDDRERLRRGYLQSLRWVAAVAAPFAVGLWVTAPEFVPVVYGERWQPVVLPMQILCAAGFVHALTSSVWTVQQAVGRPDIGFRWNAATLPLLLGALVVGAHWGVIGIACAMLAFSVAQSLAIQHVTNRLIGLAWSRWIGAVQAPVLAAAGMGAAAVVCRAAARSWSWPAAQVFLAVAGIGVVSYGLLWLWQDRTAVAELQEIWRWNRVAPASKAASLDVVTKVAP